MPKPNSTAGQLAMAAISLRLRSEPVIELSKIGRTSQGRDMMVHIARAANENSYLDRPPLRIMIIAGQHGDEPIARQAVTSLLANQEFAKLMRLSSNEIEFAFIDDANPDGSAANSRTNAKGIDLNRDHQMLQALETQAIHRFARRWQPDLLIDVHTFPSRRKTMIDQGITYRQDVQIDVANNLSIPSDVRAVSGHLLEELLTNLGSYGFCADHYLLFRKNGTIRHSTPDIVDARNGMALRLAIPSLLIEGRQPSRKDSENQEQRTHHAIVHALMAAFCWAMENADVLNETSKTLYRVGQEIPIRSKLAKDKTCKKTFEFSNSRTGTLEHRVLPNSYRPLVKPVLKTKLPAAYAIHKSQTDLLTALNRHGFESFDLPKVKDPKENRVLANYELDRVKLECNSAQLDEFSIFPVQQPGGTSLAAHLEPRSKYSLERSLGKICDKHLIKLP